VTGCGKSTTFNLILGLVPPSEGQVRVNGRDPHADFDWFRRRIAVVFQDSRLLPWRTAVQNVHAGMKFAGIPKGEWDGRARSWLSRLGLAGRESAYPHELSGGQRQRVAIARAFSVDPDIILCDESFSALDEVTARAFHQEFVELVRGNGKTGVVITHSAADHPPAGG
jgi:NitT/TauT family transport system ATP-binding protein